MRKTEKRKKKKQLSKNTYGDVLFTLVTWQKSRKLCKDLGN